MFDRPVDRASVAARFRLLPSASGHVVWRSATEMLYQHAPLRTDTDYRVLLRAGYRSASGGSSDLDHTWTFHTEGALQVSSWSPAAGDRGVDPAGSLSVTFNHPMPATGLADGFRLVPAAPTLARLDPADPHRVVLSPQGLLEPGAAYRLIATSAVRDADGNFLPGPASVAFRTGPIRPLHGWLTFVATPPGAALGTGELWAADPNRLLRRLVPAPVLDYAWAPGAGELVLETAPRTWADLQLGGVPTPLPIGADWVAPLGAGRGFVFLDHGDLALLTAAGARVGLAGGVEAAALSPDGSQLAYTVPDSSGTAVWGLTVELRSQYLLEHEPGTLLGLAWSPDGSRLAYEMISGGQSSIRVRSLAAASPATVVSGAVSDPAWDADSAHLYVLAIRGTPGTARIYRVAVGAGPQQLAPDQGLPPGTGDVGPPAPSPDGHQVAFAAGASPRAIWLMNSDGSGLTRLAGGVELPYSCRLPRWTPA